GFLILLKVTEQKFNTLASFRYSYPLARIAHTCGVYLTLFVSLHRYLGVCHPFRAQRWITRTPVKCVIIASVLFSFLINSTTWLELTVVPCYSNKFQRISQHIQLTELQMDHTYGVVMKVITYTLVMFFIPFVTLIIVNLRIILTLKESSDLRAIYTSRKSPSSRQNFKLVLVLSLELYYSCYCSVQSNMEKQQPSNCQSSARDTSVTLMLLAIVAMFLTCNGLAFCNNIIEILIFVDKIDSSDSESAFESSVEIANILVSLNSSTSIFIYLILSSKYREIVKTYLGLKIKKFRKLLKDKLIHFVTIKYCTCIATFLQYMLSQLI
ncbi:unnamed protein product, partial [Thelazia callipaeda]|uniref:G_PROTEIN_RECEP_F1_2 domain-containing protein n=1 Tax=Thelazia callipaeda TaxID=103827 RepID=A0A0N5CSQ5_THECL